MLTSQVRQHLFPNLFLLQFILFYRAIFPPQSSVKTFVIIEFAAFPLPIFYVHKHLDGEDTEEITVQTGKVTGRFSGEYFFQEFIWPFSV